MNQVDEPKKKKSGCGCFGWGCLTIIVLLALIIFGIYYFVNRMVMQYTTDTPLTLQEVNATPEEFDAVDTKFKHFVAGLKGTEPSVPLVLTDHEVNLYLNSQPDLNEIADKIRVKIESDKIGVQVNVPLEQVGWSGRYLSGEGTILAAVEKGEATIKIQSLSFNGNPVPPQAMKQIEEKNLADEIFKDPKQKKFLEAVDLIIVKNGKLIIVGKKGALAHPAPGETGSSTGELPDMPVNAPNNGAPVTEPVGVPPPRPGR